MIDQLEELANNVNKSNIEHSINVITIINLLMDKGVFTDEEFSKERIKVSPQIDQFWAEKMNQLERPSE